MLALAKHDLPWGLMRFQLRCLRIDYARHMPPRDLMFGVGQLRAVFVGAIFRLGGDV